MLIRYTLLLLPFLLTKTTADHGPYTESPEYDTGFFGSWPSESYRSTPLLGPSLNYRHRDVARDNDGEYIVLSLSGRGMRVSGPMIIDPRGRLAWTALYGQTENVDMWGFEGERYLTFWAGPGPEAGKGEGGDYYMMSFLAGYLLN